MSPQAFGYVSLPPVLDPQSVPDDTSGERTEIAACASREGYALAGVFSDVRGETESGIYRLIDALRRDEAAAVIVPDLDHLRHAGLLKGADLPTAARYLHTRLITFDGACASERGPVSAGH